MALFYSSSNTKSKTEQAIDYITEALTTVASEEKALQKSILGAERKIMPVKPANFMGQIYSVGTYKDYDFTGTGCKYNNYHYHTKTVENICKTATMHATYLHQESIKLHEANIDAIENNKLIIESVKAIMKKIGIPDTRTTYDYIGSSGRRTQKKQEHTQTAGYLQDLSHFVKTSDGFETAEASFKNCLKAIEDYRKAEQVKENIAIRAKEAEEQAKADTKALATLVVKYGLEYQAEWRNVLDEVLSRDKYLELGYWLERQRNSWADGFWKARDGINGFNVETGTDQLIYDEITSLLEDADDGRIFRDCHYNYNTLYGMVTDTTLYDDYRLIMEKVADQLD